MKLTATLEQEQEANQKRLQDLLLMMRHSDEQENEVRTFIKEIRCYAAIEKLDEAVLRLFFLPIFSRMKKYKRAQVTVLSPAPQRDTMFRSFRLYLTLAPSAPTA